MANGWKITAIIFLIITLIQFSLMFWVFNMGIEMVENENDCVYNICSDYPSYFYDDYEQICYCYENNEIVYQEYIK